MARQVRSGAGSCASDSGVCEHQYARIMVQTMILPAHKLQFIAPR
jgi:hypothetical protein